jgi:DNA polymerase III sliding clamp (beta) subunit (PCNA family)
MRLKKDELQNALEIVKPGLASKEMIEQSTSFAFMGDRVVTFNDEISISHPVEGLENLQGAIKADKLYGFLNKVKKDEIDLEVEENEIALKSGKAKAWLALEKELKLPLDEVDEVGKWQKIPQSLLDGMYFVMGSCSRDMSLPIFTCVNVRKEGFVEGSDTFRIAQYEVSDKIPISFLIPATIVHDVIKLKPNKISKGSKGWLHFKTEEGTIISCRVFENEDYPDTSKHMQIEGATIELPETIDEILERASVFAKRDHLLDEHITVKINKGKVEIQAASEYGRFKEKERINYKQNNPLEFEITPYLLRDIVSETKSFIFNGTTLLFTGENWKYSTIVRV